MAEKVEIENRVEREGEVTEDGRRREEAREERNIPKMAPSVPPMLSTELIAL